MSYLITAENGENSRKARKGGSEKKNKVLNMYFKPNMAGQASRHDGTTCMDSHANTFLPTNTLRSVFMHPKRSKNVDTYKANPRVYNDS